MPIKSMTGFGEGRAVDGEICVTVEVSSVNRKQLDINVSVPRHLTALDARIQSRVRQEFSRGRISGNVWVKMANGSGSTVRIDEGLAMKYVEGLRQVAHKLKLADNLGAETLARISGVIVVEQGEHDVDQVGEVLNQALDKALQGLSSMRACEGDALAADLHERLTFLETGMDTIAGLSVHVVASQREKLLRRLAEAGLDDLAEDERIVKEIALFADRCDISEELTRLKSHLAQARTLLGSNEPTGRTLDFLCQELFREINTIGSKANEVEITRQVVNFKTELERIREQVQNVE